MRQVALFIVVLLIASLWRPLLRPIGAGAVIVADIYSGALWDRNLAAAVTPRPRVEEATLRIRDADMRVTWWIPGWGARHPGVMLVNGATEFGNDDSETRRLSDALARAGYLVMLPEFPFIKAGTLEREATAIIDAAFAVLRDHPETRGMPTGAFGFSVGGGMLLAAASRPGSLEHASYVGALGAYFDLDTYLASVLGSAQRRNGAVEPWDPDPEVRLRLPLAAAQAIANPTDRERLSPRTSWSALRPEVFWLHDVGDRFEPVSEGENAAATAHVGATHLHRTALISHAAALGQGARERGVDFWAGELSGLLLFAAQTLSAGG